MSFGLKNAGATYQRAIQQCLSDQIRDQLVEAYVDDVVAKTKVASTLVDDLDQTFKALNKFQWKLNPKKCIFGVPSGILLGNIVSHEGIRRWSLAQKKSSNGRWSLAHIRSNSEAARPSSHRHWSISLLNGQI
jgi:hypothetical protein